MITRRPRCWLSRFMLTSGFLGTSVLVGRWAGLRMSEDPGLTLYVCPHRQQGYILTGVAWAPMHKTPRERDSLALP